MKRSEYQASQNSICFDFDYDIWAIKQLQNNYDGRRLLLEWKAEQLADLVPAHIHISSALEVGVAEGIVIKRIGELLRIEKCMGVDISNVFLSLGKSCYSDIKFFYYDGSHLPFDNKSIDLIILSDIIEHISDLNSFLREIRRVGKYVLLKVPLYRYLLRKLISVPLGRSFQVGPGHPDGHLHEFSRRSLEKVLKIYGMKILNFRVVYRPVLQSEDYRVKKGILKARWYLDSKLKQLFPQFAHKIFGGDYISFLLI